jgi:hypothetical protein
MTRTAAGIGGAGGKGREKGEGREAKHQAEDDGEIKGPGPFGSMALMVLKNFRDLVPGRGPGFVGFLVEFRGLPGTCALGARP